MNEPINVLVLNASLKHAPAPSNTEEVVEMVLGEMRTLAPIEVVQVRLPRQKNPGGPPPPPTPKA